MTIHVERDGDAAMSQQFLYHFCRNPHCSQYGCRAVPKVMEPHVRQPGLFQERGEEHIEALGIEEPAVDVAEDEIVFLPIGTSFELELFLTNTVLPKRFQHKLW